jgi:hypothetical protein
MMKTNRLITGMVLLLVGLALDVAGYASQDGTGKAAAPETPAANAAPNTALA